MVGMSLMMGGNVRVGLEDNMRVRRRENADSNAVLVDKAVAMAALFDREPATPAEARERLGLKGADQVAF